MSGRFVEAPGVQWGFRDPGECVCADGERHSSEEGGLQLGFKELLPSHSQVKELEALGGEPCSE